MRVYLDACCLNRPFDSQLQDRIRLESEAILRILERCKKGMWKFISSEVVDFEISRITEIEKKRNVLNLATISTEKIVINQKIKERAKVLNNDLGFFPADALHIAYAEEGKVDVLFTTDDRMLKKYNNGKDKLKVRIENPLIWLVQEDTR